MPVRSRLLPIDRRPQVRPSQRRSARSPNHLPASSEKRKRNQCATSRRNPLPQRNLNAHRPIGPCSPRSNGRINPPLSHSPQTSPPTAQNPSPMSARENSPRPTHPTRKRSNSPSAPPTKADPHSAATIHPPRGATHSEHNPAPAQASQLLHLPMPRPRQHLPATPPRRPHPTHAELRNSSPIQWQTQLRLQLLQRKTRLRQSVAVGRCVLSP